LDVDGRRDLGVQLDGDLVRAGALDRVDDLDAAAVDLGPAGGLHGVGDVARGDRAEQAAGLAGAGGQAHLQGAELAGDFLGGADVADLTGGARLADGLDLALGAAGPAHGVAARDEVVAAVAVLDLDDVAGGAEAGDLVGEDELHFDKPP